MSHCRFPLLFSISIISLLVSSCGSSDTTSLNSSSTSLEGSWNFHSLRSGVSPRWRHGKDQFDINNTATRLEVSRSNINQDLGAPYTLVVDTNNDITRTDDTSYHGTLTNNDLIVNTRSRNADSSFRLHFLQKQTGTYNINDLSGTWNFHTLSSGSTNSWRHGIEQIDTSGNVTRVSTITSDGSNTLGSNYSLNIDSTGIVTRPDIATYHGSMSADKSLMINTRSKESGTTFRVKILQKHGATFNTADLQGTWKYHNLVTGIDASWERGVDTIDANGVVTRVSRINNQGDTALTNSHTLIIDSTGVITRTDNISFHGVMSENKKLIIITTTSDLSGGYRMKVLQKM